MVQLILSWVYIGVHMVIWSLGIKKALTRFAGVESEETDIRFLMAIAMLTVYAQVFSLVSGVGLIANLGLILTDVLILLWTSDEWKRFLHELPQRIRSAKWQLLLWGVLMVILAASSAGSNNHYDTELYHGQAIRWIEEYGIVKGLGNLHNRLAYNSSFFALQALFSLKFIAGQSLRNLNGFCAWLMIGLSFSTMRVWREKRFFTSDLLKVMVAFTLAKSTYLTSDSTDLFTMELAIYIFAKWVEYVEKHEECPDAYAILCLLIVYAITLKVSAGFLVVLVLKPAVLLLRQKEWKKVGFYIGWGVLILLPFLIRNVILSGYLLYPYASIDLFSVDWKMPAEAVRGDAAEIMRWGQNMQYSNIAKPTLRQWLPVWFADQEGYVKLLLRVTGAMIPIGILWGFVDRIRTKSWDRLLIQATSTICFLGWLFSAPLVRYGKAWFLIGFALPVGKMLELVDEWISRKQFSQYHTFKRVCMALLCGAMLIKHSVCLGDKQLWIKQMDYAVLKNEAIEWNDFTFYVPQEGWDQVGYQSFPGTFRHVLPSIQLRGSDLSEGFRVRE